MFEVRRYRGDVVTHIHDFHQVVLPLEGRLSMVVSGTEGYVSSGSVALVAAGESHNFTGSKSNSFLVIDIKGLGVRDVPLPEANNNEISVAHIQDYFEILDEVGTRPVSYGGDHAITGPILKALGGSGTNIAGGQKLSLVHFDAHRDDYEHIPHWLGAKRSAAHWAAYTVREGHVDVERSIQIGIRGNPMKPMEDPAQSNTGYRVLPAAEIFDIGIDRAATVMQERVGDNPIYISFDLDALDPADARGSPISRPVTAAFVPTKRFASCTACADAISWARISSAPCPPKITALFLAQISRRGSDTQHATFYRSPTRQK